LGLCYGGTLGIASDGDSRADIEEVANDARTAGANNLDNFSALGRRRRVCVIDYDRFSLRERRLDQIELPRVAFGAFGQRSLLT
jgi:hypothetical protein